METTNKLKPVMMVAIAALFAFGATQAYANGSDTMNVSGEIQNAVDIAEEEPISFGTVAISIRGGTTTQVVMLHGTAGLTFDNVNDASSRMLSVPGGTVNDGRFTISGTPPTTTLDVSFVADPIICVDVSCAGSGDFTFDNITSNAGGGQITTGPGGTAELVVGGRLITDNAGPYLDGTYEGDLTVTVDYP